MLGTELFGNRSEKIQLPHDSHTSFETPGSAIFALFQLLTTSNWHEILYLQRSVNPGAFTDWFFVSFMVIVVYGFMNVLLALILEIAELRLSNRKDLIRKAKIRRKEIGTSSASVIVYQSSQTGFASPLISLSSSKQLVSKKSGTFFSSRSTTTGAYSSPHSASEKLGSHKPSLASTATKHKTPHSSRPQSPIPTHSSSSGL